MARRATVKMQETKGTAPARVRPRGPTSRRRRPPVAQPDGFDLFLSLLGKGECEETDISSDKYRYLYGTPDGPPPKRR